MRGFKGNQESHKGRLLEPLHGQTGGWGPMFTHGDIHMLAGQIVYFLVVPLPMHLVTTSLARWN